MVNYYFLINCIRHRRHDVNLVCTVGLPGCDIRPFDNLKVTFDETI